MSQLEMELKFLYSNGSKPQKFPSTA